MSTSYDDIILHRMSSVTFGSLYEILLREGFEPVGTPWHYRFIGQAGELYEISYDFSDAPYNESDSGYYYLKDQEPVLMPHKCANYFSFDQVKEMTGLKLVGT